MSQYSLIKPTPWDAATFGIPTWELLEYSIPALQQSMQTPGHHTIRVDSLADKRLLHEFGFYYCDTLIEPNCDQARLISTHHADATISKEVVVDQIVAIGHGAFTHGRFHRDFNLSRAAADLRYDNWLLQLIENHQIYGLHWQGELAGFIGYSGTNLVLHAIAEKYRCKGLSKYWWSAVCNELFSIGGRNITSSISATNLAVVKLYASLGFSFQTPKDIYHFMVQ